MRNAYPLLAALLLVIAGCKKESKTTDGLTANPTNLQLVSMAWSFPALHFSYDPGTHLLTGYSGGYALLRGGLDSPFVHLVYSQGQLSCLYSEEFADDTTSFHYNTEGWPDTITKKEGLWVGPPSALVEATLVQTIRYNGSGQPADSYVYTTGPDTTIDHYTFSYDNNGDLTRAVDSNLTAHPVSVSITTYTGYDNKINFIRALNGFPATDLFDRKLGVWYTFSPNNVGTITKNDSVAVSYTYRYNSAGLPTTIIYGQDTVALTYQQY